MPSGVIQLNTEILFNKKRNSEHRVKDSVQASSIGLLNQKNIKSITIFGWVRSLLSRGLRPIVWGP